jgi:transposase
MNASFVLGIDPGKSFLAATLMHSTGERIWKGRQFDMSREGFDELISSLPDGDVTVGIEASGRIDDNLLAWFGRWRSCCANRKIAVIRVNPGQSARFGGPKPRRDQTDESDSDHVGEFTRVYAHRLEAFEHDPKAQAMVRLINERQHRAQELAATKNRIHEQLLVCFPEFTRIFADPFAKLARAVLRQVPTARQAAQRRPLSLARVKAGHKERSLGTEAAQQLIQLAQRSIASACEDNDAAAMIFLLDQLDLLEKRLANIEETLSAYAAQADHELGPAAAQGVSAARQVQLLDSIPGMATVAASTLVLGTRGIARFDSGSALAAQWASCPERTKTGTSLDKTRLTARGDHKRRATLYLATQVACMYDPAFAFHKWRMIQRGLCPQQAVCAAMNRMARVAWALVDRNQTYDVNRMIGQIQIHHAELWKTFVRLHQNNRSLWRKVAAKYKKVA